MTFTIAILVTLIGTALAARGIRGRRFADDAPRCRRCGYDLRAKTGERCPECGASLADRRAITRGRIRRRPRWIALGVAVAVVGGATIELDRRGWLNVVRLEHASPSAVLFWLARNGTPGLRAAAFGELVLRYQYPTVFRPLSLDEQHALAEALVDAYVDPAIAWEARFSMPIDAAVIAGTSSPGARRKYFEQICRECVNVRLKTTTLRPDDPLELEWDFKPGRIVNGYRDPPASFFTRWVAVSQEEYTLTLDGMPIDVGHIGLRDGRVLCSLYDMPRGHVTQGFPRIVRLPAAVAERAGGGKHALTVHMPVEIRNGWDLKSPPFERYDLNVAIPITIELDPATRPGPDGTATLPFRRDVR